MDRAERSPDLLSAHARARLEVLTRTGRSKPDVIEEALDRMPDPPLPDAIGVEERRARIMAILARIDSSRIPSMAEFDAREYDDRGNPR